MNPEDLQLLFAYNRWADAKVLDACKKLSQEQLFAAAPVSFGSLMGTLAHILGAAVNWRLRMQEGLSPTFILLEKDFPDLATLTTRWQEEETVMEQFIQSITPEHLNRYVEYTTMSGKLQGNTVWKALVHVVNHGTQFRGEAGVILTNFGHSPGDLDLLLYIRESDQR